jgi:hypothetical protein
MQTTRIPQPTQKKIHKNPINSQSRITQRLFWLRFPSIGHRNFDKWSEKTIGFVTRVGLRLRYPCVGLWTRRPLTPYASPSHSQSRWQVHSGICTQFIPNCFYNHLFPITIIYNHLLTQLNFPTNLLETTQYKIQMLELSANVFVNPTFHDAEIQRHLKREHSESIQTPDHPRPLLTFPSRPFNSTQNNN